MCAATSDLEQLQLSFKSVEVPSHPSQLVNGKQLSQLKPGLRALVMYGI